MPNNVSFQDGDGIKRFTTVSGTGTQQDPYVFVFTTADGNPLRVTFDSSATIGVVDSSGNRLIIDNNGASRNTFIDEVAAPLPSSTTGIIGLIRGLWGSIVTFVSNFGNANELPNAFGTLMARLRFITSVFLPTSRYVSYGTAFVDRLSINSSLIYSVYIWNKSNSIRYFQLFNQSNVPTNGSVPTESFVIAPNEKFTLDSADFGLGGNLFSFGLCWGWSNNENLFSAGTASEVTTIIRWRNN